MTGECRMRLTNAAALPALGIFAVVIGGIYSGVFTPTEAAAVGVMLTLGAGFAPPDQPCEDFKAALIETATTAAMIYMILLGADLFSAFLARTQAPQMLTEWAAGSGLVSIIILIGVLLLYLVLGCLMDSLSMIILTVPLFFPLIVSLDFGLTPTEVAIWFGILTLVVVEVGPDHATDRDECQVHHSRCVLCFSSPFRPSRWCLCDLRRRCACMGRGRVRWRETTWWAS
jgi:C4-dicarboxylate transporter DctM subunit